MNKQIIVALDGMSKKDAVKIAQILKGKVWGFKVNDLLHEDTSIIKELKKYGKVFADVKLYDIPNTVANSVRRLSKHGVDIITVHASGGIEMMQAARKESGKSKIIAVTVLTSSKLKYKNEVLDLVKDSIKTQMDGIVCSGHELDSIHKIKGSGSLIKVVPGIRPSWYKTKDDQVRKMSPKQVIDFGASFLVIGRPITDGILSTKSILKNLDNLWRE
ncbi:MAG: orotidine-5'-phosphate decarboxylase [Parcubacteria group bacterium]